MPVIKDHQISENAWTYVADEAPLVNGDITVSVTRWNNEKAQLLERSSKVGVRLMPSDTVDSISDDLGAISLIELNFPVYTDGRSFSQARLLKDRCGYTGELRATGNFLADQVFYLHRVGIDSFEFNDPKAMEVGLAAMKDFSSAYQTSTR